MGTHYRTDVIIVPPFFLVNVKFVLKCVVGLYTGARSDTKISKPTYSSLYVPMYFVFVLMRVLITQGV